MRVPLFAWAILAALLIGLPPAAGSGQQPVAVDVTLTDYQVSLPSTTIQAGVPVQFTVHNQGRVTHEAVLERAGATDQAIQIDGKEAELPDILPGETRIVTWTLAQPGEYQLACHIPGHYEAGMVARLTVLAPDNGQLVSQVAPGQASLPVLDAPAAPGSMASVRAWALGWVAAVVLALAGLGLLVLELKRRLERGCLDCI